MAMDEPAEGVTREGADALVARIESLEARELLATELRERRYREANAVVLSVTAGAFVVGAVLVAQQQGLLGEAATAAGSWVWTISVAGTLLAVATNLWLGLAGRRRAAVRQAAFEHRFNLPAE